MRVRATSLFLALVVLATLLVWYFRRAPASPIAAASASAISPTPAAASGSDSAPTRVYAHNLMLRQGPNFRFYVRWLRAEMLRTNPQVNPSFDDLESFVLNIKTGVLRANIGDFTHYLNAAGVAGSNLTNINVSGDGDQIKLNATLHRVVPLPVEMIGVLSPLPDGRIRVRVTKINVLKIPFKGLLGGFHVTLSDLFHPTNPAGLAVSGNDIVFDPQRLLPPPHIRGQLTNVRIVSPDIEEIYGNAEKDVANVEQWRNFIRLAGGTVDFGKLTMRHVDLVMVDVSSDPWFDLDLTHYVNQLVYGYTRMTPQAGLQIFMPDLSRIPHNKSSPDIGIAWMKNRNMPPPAEVTPNK